MLCAVLEIDTKILIPGWSSTGRSLLLYLNVLLPSCTRGFWTPPFPTQVLWRNWAKLKSDCLWECAFKLSLYVVYMKPNVNVRTTLIMERTVIKSKSRWSTERLLINANSVQILVHLACRGGHTQGWIDCRDRNTRQHMKIWFPSGYFIKLLCLKQGDILERLKSMKRPTGRRREDCLHYH